MPPLLPPHPTSARNGVLALRRKSTIYHPTTTSGSGGILRAAPLRETSPLFPPSCTPRLPHPRLPYHRRCHSPPLHAEPVGCVWSGGPLDKNRPTRRPPGGEGPPTTCASPLPLLMVPPGGPRRCIRRSLWGNLGDRRRAVVELAGRQTGEGRRAMQRMDTWKEEGKTGARETPTPPWR